jgi:hypothetical protein
MIADATAIAIAIAGELVRTSANWGWNQTSGKTVTVDTSEAKVFLSNSEGSDESRVCFGGRSVEFTDTGVRRQQPTDEVWGDVPAPAGTLLKAPAPGEAGQDARLMVAPTVGDFATRADSAAIRARVKFSYRPGYLFAREATDEP